MRRGRLSGMRAWSRWSTSLLAMTTPRRKSVLPSARSRNNSGATRNNSSTRRATRSGSRSACGLLSASACHATGANSRWIRPDLRGLARREGPNSHAAARPSHSGAENAALPAVRPLRPGSSEACWSHQPSGLAVCRYHHELLGPPGPGCAGRGGRPVPGSPGSPRMSGVCPSQE